MATNLSLTYLGTEITQLIEDKIFDIPLFATADISTSAFSIIINFPQDKLEIQDVVFSNEEPIQWFVPLTNQLRIGWFASDTKEIPFTAGNEILKIRAKVIQNFGVDEVLKINITDDIENEFGYNVIEDGIIVNVEVIPNVVLSTFMYQNGNLLVAQKKVIQGYETKPFVEKCSNCANYVDRRCTIGKFVVGKSAKCNLYERSEE